MIYGLLLSAKKWINGLLALSLSRVLLSGLIFTVLACQPTNTRLGKKSTDSSSTGGGTASPIDSQWLAVRITGTDQIPFTATSLSMALGDSLTLKAGLYRIDNTFVENIDVRWGLRTVDGQLVSGLSCGTSLTNTCTLTPSLPGAAIVEVTLSQRRSDILGWSDASPPITVTAPSLPTSISVSSGNGQIGLMDANLGLPLVALVKDAFDRPVPGVSVQFAATSGGGTIVGANPLLTDTNGLASATVKLSTAVGTNNHTFTATVVSNNSLVANYTASALPGAVASLELQTPPLATYSNLPFSQQPVVVAKDSAGNIVSTLNTPLSVSVQTGNGSLSGNQTKNFINGVVSFTDLAYSISDANVVLRFTATGGVSVDSSPLSFTTPSGVGGITPDDVNFSFKVTESPGAGGRSTSNPVTISGLTQAISVSVTGAGNPRLRLNGGAEVSALFSVNNTDTLMVVADAPSTPGTNIVSITMGGRSETFEVRHADPTSLVYGFVKNNPVLGVSVNNASCTASANTAGYGGNWVALAATTTASLKDIMPYRWSTFKRLDGLPIANSWEELWTGPLLNPLNISEIGNTINSRIHTGTVDPSTLATSGNSCTNWTTNGGGGVGGHSQNTTSLWYYNNSNGCSDGSVSIYCVSDPTGLLDSTPNTLKFQQKIVTSSGGRYTSNTLTISGLTTRVSASIAGASGTPQFMVNGGAAVTSAVVENGDQIQLVMDAPATIGSTQLASLTVGTLTFDWRIRYADPNNQAVVFVTSGNHIGGALSGLSGAHALCQSSATAAGLDGTWTAMLTDSNTGDLNNLIPWNWGTLRRMDGSIIANDWADLWDATIDNAINITELNTTKNSDVWTGVTNASGTGASITNDDCNRWTWVTGYYGRVGRSFGVDNQWITTASTFTCGSALPLYCISNPGLSLDTTPTDLNFLKEVSYVAGARTTSNVVTVKGITTSVSVSVSGSSGNPQLKINGGTEVASGTVNWGDTIEVVMDAPSVLGTLNTATLAVGTLIKSWQVGYADSTKVARVFLSTKPSNGNLGGLAGADILCNQDATNAGYTTGSWKALLSDSATNARDRISFNWGHLKLVDGSTTIADSGQELWSGTIQAPINLQADGITVAAVRVFSTTKTNGLRQSSVSSTNENCSNWTASTDVSYFYTGQSGQTGTNWISSGSVSSACSNGLSFYCVEDTSAGNDLKPTSFTMDYKIFQPTSTRIDSNTVTISGLTPGVSAAIVITGSTGSPAFKINGGAEVTSGSVVNGDTLTLVMTSPSNYNESHKMEVQVGTSGVIPWRLWTGDAASGVQKRIFITSTSSLNGNLGGLGGADLLCQNLANTNVNLAGMTWKAIVSGDATQEAGWAINRIGYDWAELWTFNPNGTLKDRIFSHSAIWNGSAPENAFNLNEMGALVTTSLSVLTNTSSNGRGRSSGSPSCLGFTSSSSGSGGVSFGFVNDINWIFSATTYNCGYAGFRLYCIQQ